MRHPACWLIASSAFLALAAECQAQTPEELAASAKKVFKAHCHRCHSGDGSSSGYDFDVTRRETLVKPASGEPWVVAGDLLNSPIWDAIQKRMPQRGSSEREAFGDEQRQIIKKWIEAGAPAFPIAVERPFISLKEVLQGIRDHLARAEPEDRPYLRYFSLAHVHNNSAFEEEDLRYLRAALSKVLNSLSWKPQIAQLEQLDKAGTLFAIDIRKLDWDRANRWKKLTDAYPYGLKFGSFPDRSLKELDREIVSYSNCDLPWLRADWFVATASRPPLYHDLLQLPGNAKTLEEKLGVNIPENFRNDQLARAGFAKSGVSGQNRLVERHDSPFGAYWKSYDFLPENGRSNLIRFPLGPVFERNTYHEQAFRQDGGEIIFNLPNGLQAYMLVKGNDDRIDAGPIDVVSDDKRVSGTPAIVNGISCHSCHLHGMIPFTDTIREGKAVFGEAAIKVSRIYPESKRMNELIEKDKRRFLTALDETTGRFLRVGADKETLLVKFKEPITEVVVGYRRGYLDLKAIAHELFLKDGDELLKKLREKRLKELGLEAVARPGGLVGRYQWESLDGVSLMQEVARELGYTPLH